MQSKTLKLTSERLIGSHHLPPGTRVTLADREADALIKQGHAVQVAFDASAKVPPPRLREMIQTATTDPGPRKAARLTGQSQ
jgi:hypothetical protein